MFAFCLENLSEDQFKVNGLICLVEEISIQEGVNAVATACRSYPGLRESSRKAGQNDKKGV